MQEQNTKGCVVPDIGSNTATRLRKTLCRKGRIFRTFLSTCNLKTRFVSDSTQFQVIHCVTNNTILININISFEGKCHLCTYSYHPSFHEIAMLIYMKEMLKEEML